MEQILQNELKKKLLFVTSFILLISFVSAADWTFPQNQEATISHPARLDGEISPNTVCNITIYYPNGTKLVDFDEMTDEGDTFTYNLTSNHTSIKGEYEYELTCVAGTHGATEPYSYLINLGGIEPTEQRTQATTRTIYIFFGLAFVTFLSLFWLKKPPVKISLFLIMIWFILMGVNAAYISIQDEVLNSNIETFFSFFLTISFWANYAIFITIIIIWTITFVVNVTERKKRSLVKDYG